MAKPLSFKDFLTVDYTPGEDELISTNAKDRKHEALNFQQRKARARVMRKNKARISMGRKRAARRAASPEKLLNRAKKLARRTLFKKLSKGKSKDELPFQRRQEIEKRLEKLKGRIEKMARKNLPTVRKMDKERRQPKKEK